MLMEELDFNQRGESVEEERERAGERIQEERDHNWSPPPRLPELKGLGSKEKGEGAGFFGGGDMFQDIK